MNKDSSLNQIQANFLAQSEKTTANQDESTGQTVVLSTQGYQNLVNTTDGENLHWTTDINAELPIKMPLTGMAADLKPETVTSVFLRQAKARDSAPALRVMRDNKEYVWSWTQFRNDAMAFAKSLHHIGVDERSVVNIMGFNAPEWAIAYFGSIVRNSPASGVYATNGPDACLYQAQHSGSQCIVVETIQHLQLYLSIVDKIPGVKALVVYGVDKVPAELQKDQRVYTFRQFLELGKDIKDSAIEPYIKKQRPGQCCTLIYTSGTTGNPKGVMLSHDNLIFNSTSLITDALKSLPEDRSMDPQAQRVVSYLPLSHIAGLQFDLTNTIVFGSQIYFAKPDALQGTLVETLNWCRPTMFLAVPRIWEKFEDKLKALAASKPAFLQSISGWAKGYGYSKVIAQQTNGDAPLMYSLANFLILKRIKQAIGLDQAEFCFYGAAPLKQTSVDYFASLDIPLFNLYGLSETTGSTTKSGAVEFSLAHAGQAMSGSTVMIADPDEKGQGEIQIRGRHVMMGYLNNREATLDCITKDGFFKSGDQGRFDKGGYLKITGRIKELIITAGGENIAPVPIEDQFKEQCPICSNIMLIGENRRFMGALITLKAEMDMKTGLPSKELLPETIEFIKKNIGVDVKDSETASKNEKIYQYIQKCVEETNKRVVSKAAHIKKFVLLPLDFSQPGGELTPTMKLKRKVTEQKYQDIVEHIYAAQAKL